MSDSEICDSEASDMPLMELDEYLEMIVVPKVIGLMRGVLGEVDEEECLRLTGLKSWESVADHLLSTADKKPESTNCRVETVRSVSGAINPDKCFHHSNLRLVCPDKRHCSRQ